MDSVKPYDLACPNCSEPNIIGILAKSVLYWYWPKKYVYQKHHCSKCDYRWVEARVDAKEASDG
jgi:C4-type Zn-finger protein